MKKEEIIAEVIVDMYEIRASVIPPFKAGEDRTMEKVENLFQYNFLSTMISHICDKYNVKHDDIESVIKERPLERLRTKDL